MPYFNKVVLIGNVTKDPEVRYLTNGTKICIDCLAVNRKYKDKEEVLFIDFTVFGKLADIVEQYVTKGSCILIEGRLVLDKWEKDGRKYSKHKVIVDGLQLLGSNKQAEQKPKETQEDEEVPF